MAKFELKTLVTGVDHLSPVLEKMQKSLKRLKTEANDNGGSGLAIGLTVPLKAFAKQEDALTGLKVALMQSNGEVDSSFENINKLAVGLGNQLPGSTADFQNMMQVLVQQGIPAQNILAGVGKATAYLAVQLEKTPADAAEFAAKMQDATGTASKDMMGLSDTLQKAFNLGVNDTDMLGFFTQTRSVLKMVSQDGLTAAQNLAPISVMMDQMGMQGESAGNALRKVMQAGLDTETVGAVNKTLSRQKLGFQLDFTDGKGNFGGLDNLFKQLSKLRGLSDVKQDGILTSLFGDDAEMLQVASTLINEGKEGYDQIQQKMDKQASLNQRVEMQLSTLTNLWESLTGMATNGLAAIGGVFSKDAKSLISLLGDLGYGFMRFAEQNPIVIRSMVGLAGGLAMLKLGFMGVGGAISLVSRVMSMSPIGMIATGLALAAGLIISNWDTIGPYFKALWETISPYFESGWEMLKEAFNWTPLGLVINNWGPIVQWFRDMWEGLKPIISWFTDGSDDFKAQPWDAYGTRSSSSDRGLAGYNLYPAPSPVGSAGVYNADSTPSSNERSGSDNPYLMLPSNKNADSAIQPPPDWHKNSWTITPQVTSQPTASVVVDFRNAPAGMRVTDTQSRGIDVNHDVGYSTIYGISNPF